MKNGASGEAKRDVGVDEWILLASTYANETRNDILHSLNDTWRWCSSIEDCNRFDKFTIFPVQKKSRLVKFAYKLWLVN